VEFSLICTQELASKDPSVKSSRLRGLSLTEGDNLSPSHIEYETHANVHTHTHCV